MVQTLIRWTLILTSVIWFIFSAYTATAQEAVANATTPKHRFKGNDGFTYKRSPANKTNQTDTLKKYFKKKPFIKDDSWYDRDASSPSPTKSSRRRTRSVVMTPAMIRQLRDRQLKSVQTAQKKAPLFGSPEFGASPLRKIESSNVAAKPAINKKPSVPKTISSPFAKFSSLVPTSHTANKFQVLAEENFFRGDYKEAAKSSDQTMAIDPNNPQVKMFASLANIAAGDFAKAGRLFREAATHLDPAEWYRVIASSNNFYGSNEFEIHLERLSTFCEHNPYQLDAIRLRGFLSLMNGNLSIARTDFQTVLTSLPKDRVTNALFKQLESENWLDNKSNGPAIPASVSKIEKTTNPYLNESK